MLQYSCTATVSAGVPILLYASACSVHCYLPGLLGGNLQQDAFWPVEGGTVTVIVFIRPDDKSVVKTMTTFAIDMSIYGTLP